MNIVVPGKNNLSRTIFIWAVSYILSVGVAYYLGRRGRFTCQDLRIEPKVTVFPSQPLPSYLIEPIVELNGKRFRHGRAVYVDSSGKVIGWLLYDRDEVIDRFPKGTVFDEPRSGDK